MISDSFIDAADDALARLERNLCGAEVAIDDGFDPASDLLILRGMFAKVTDEINHLSGLCDAQADGASDAKAVR